MNVSLCMCVSCSGGNNFHWRENNQLSSWEVNRKICFYSLSTTHSVCSFFRHCHLLISAMLHAFMHLMHGFFPLLHLAYFLSHPCNPAILFFFFLKYHFLTLLVLPSSGESNSWLKLTELDLSGLFPNPPSLCISAIETHLFELHQLVFRGSEGGEQWLEVSFSQFPFCCIILSWLLIPSLKVVLSIQLSPSRFCYYCI